MFLKTHETVSNSWEREYEVNDYFSFYSTALSTIQAFYFTQRLCIETFAFHKY